ncbi:S8 family serine peptidase [Neobacillus terrae]|uniref:S8 family serine peptidase n=1 Tax=Neobacillus terrae TaxID=3034837 RepID=UPI001407AD01|nr:S8 family serine peptidase [Neobacillus terrae]NHM33030.1 S8 family serine peptidase [Neobacillus terrae]
MKKTKKGMAILASSLLALSLATIPKNVMNTAHAQNVAKKYLIAYSQSSLPAGYQTAIKNAGGTVISTMPEVGGVEVSSSDPSFLDKLGKVANISAANLERTYKLDTEKPTGADGQPVTITEDADGTYWSSQWDIRHLTNEGKSFAVESGGTEKNGKVTHKAIVGVIDTGIDANHPDLKANYVGGRNYVPAGGYNHEDLTDETGDPTDVLDREGHGTHVAGSIAGNGKIKGVGPDLGIMAYRIFDSSGSAPTAPIVEAIIGAANDKVDVINMSIGGFDNLKYYYEGTRYSDIADVLLWKRAVQYAVKKNVTVVAAAGNESLNYDDKKSLTDYMNAVYSIPGLVYKGVAVETPGGTPGVITVSSSNKWSTKDLAFYSNYGNSFIDVAAPGGDNGPAYANTGNLIVRDFTYRALATWPTYLPQYFTTLADGYAYLHGTSMASPKVAGIAGLIKAKHPEYSPSQVKAVIKQTALDYGKPGQDSLFGFGEANAYTAVTQK